MNRDDVAGAVVLLLVLGCVVVGLFAVVGGYYW